MATTKIHRGDDITIISPLPIGVTHSDYIDIECKLIGSIGDSVTLYNKNGDKDGFLKLIFEPDALNIGIPIDTNITNKLNIGNHFLLIRYIFNDAIYEDNDRRQSDTINIFEIVDDKISTSIGSNIFQIGINGTTKGDDGDSAYQVAINNGFVGDEASWLLSLEGAEGAKGDKGDKGDNGADGVNPVGAVLLQKADLTVNANNIEIDFNNRDQFASTNRVEITADATISLANNSIAQFATFKVIISNLAKITFPIGTISPSDSIVNRVFTPSENGNYTFSLYITGSEIEVIVSYKKAI